MKEIKQGLFIPRKATKEHICSACGEMIGKKEKYIFYAPEESNKKDKHLHYNCAYKIFKKGLNNGNKN